MSEQLMTVAEVAWRLRTSRSFIDEVIADGRLKRHRLGRGQGGPRVSEAQLAAFLRETECAGTAVERPLKFLK